MKARRPRTGGTARDKRNALGPTTVQRASGDEKPSEQAVARHARHLGHNPRTAAPVRLFVFSTPDAKPLDEDGYNSRCEIKWATPSPLRNRVRHNWDLLPAVKVTPQAHHQEALINDRNSPVFARLRASQSSDLDGFGIGRRHHAGGS